MIDHIGIVVKDHAASKAFYTKALGAIGGKVMYEFQKNETIPVSGWGRDEPTFWMTSCPERAAGEITPMHFAFSCPDRASVDKFYEAAIAAGGTCNGKPGVRAQYHPNYYGAFVKDLDGHNIEAVCHLPPA